MKRQVRDRIEQLEQAAANRSPQGRDGDGEWVQALREVALDGFPRFRAHVIEVLRLHGAQTAEDFAGLGIRFHEEVHPGREFRHEVQGLLVELGVIDVMQDPICWCAEVCYPRWRAAQRRTTGRSGGRPLP